MANNQQSDSNNLNYLARQLKSTLSENVTDCAEKDIDQLIQNIQLVDEDTASSDELLSSISNQSPSTTADNAEGSDDAEDSDNFDKPLFFAKRPLLVLLSVVLLIGLIGGGFFLFLHSSQAEGNDAEPQISESTEPQIPETTEALIPNSVCVAGIQIGGMTQSQAVAALEQSIPSFSQESVVISFHENSLVLTPEDIDFSLNINDAVDAAMNITDTSSERFDLDIQPYVHLNEQQILNRFNDFFAEESSSFVQSSYRLEGLAPVLSHDHYDPETSAQRLILNRGVPCPIQDTNAHFESFIDNYLKGNLQIQFEEKNIMQLPDELNLESIHRILSTDPVASRLEEDGKTFVPGDYGYTFSIEEAQQALSAAEYGEDVSIPMQLIFPDFEGSSLFPDELASYVLPCDTNSLPNTRITCLKINGTIVNHGKKFSMTECFAATPVSYECMYGPLEDDGDCIVASAIFHAALEAGMDDFTDKKHSYVVSYTEPAFDVLFINKESDFKFLNVSHNPILILTEFQPDGIHVRILGTEFRDYTIELNQITETNLHYTTTTKKVHSVDGYAQNDVIQAGINGYIGKLEIVKRSKKSGEVLSTGVLRNLYYNPRSQIIADVVD